MRIGRAALDVFGEQKIIVGVGFEAEVVVVAVVEGEAAIGERIVQRMAEVVFADHHGRVAAGMEMLGEGRGSFRECCVPAGGFVEALLVAAGD